MQRKSIVDNLTQALRVFAQALIISVAKRQRVCLIALGAVVVFSNLSFSEPRKAADLAGRGLSAPLWSPDDRFLAYTTVDKDELYVLELNEIKVKQSLYRVSNLEGVGRRFVFVPGEERLAYRTVAGALKTHADRILSTSFFVHDNKMISTNTDPIIGPYSIENKIFYRHDLSQPILTLDGQPWEKSVTLVEGVLSIHNAQKKVTYISPAELKVEGFEISPNGEWVAAVVKSEAGRQVMLVEISSGLTRDLGEGRWPSWSGNSQRVVIIRDKPNVMYAELLVYDLKHQQIRSVTGLNQFWPDEPALNSDGTRVAFTHDHEIYITEVTGF